MGTVILGRTGIKSGKNAFGALPVQRLTKEHGARLLRSAFDAGITFFDTARSYSDSEEKIGMGLADVRARLVIATKTPASTPEDFWKNLDTSLRLLKTDYIDLYQFHNPARCYRPGDGTGMYEAMLEARERGKIRFIGITNHRADIAAQAVESGLYDTLQFPFSYLSAKKDIELVELCREKNMGFIAMKALSGGLVTNAAAAYAWLDQFDNVLPIWGIQRESELEEFISFREHPPRLTQELQAVIDADRRELSGNFCRGCGYCMPCPVGIQINLCARMSQLIRRAPSEGYLTQQSQDMMMNVENCLECGQCTARCPYELDTPSLLKRNLEDYKNILAGKAAI